MLRQHRPSDRSGHDPNRRMGPRASHLAPNAHRINKPITPTNRLVSACVGSPRDILGEKVTTSDCHLCQRCTLISHTNARLRLVVACQLNLDVTVTCCHVYEIIQVLLVHHMLALRTRHWPARPVYIERVVLDSKLHQPIEPPIERSSSKASPPRRRPLYTR